MCSYLCLFSKVTHVCDINEDDDNKLAFSEGLQCANIMLNALYELTHLGLHQQPCDVGTIIIPFTNDEFGTETPAPCSHLVADGHLRWSNVLI